MSVCIDYPDIVKFVQTSINGYGTETKVAEIEVPAIVVQNTGYNHSSNQDAIISDSVLYVDPDDAFVQANHFRLEEYQVVIPTFGGLEEDNYYKVISVQVSKDHLLCNDIDSVELLLKKVSNIQDVS